MSENLRARMRDELERELIERARAKLAAQAAAGSAPPRAAQATTPGDGLEQDVLRLAAAALRMPEDRIDPDENLANYGVDSIAITEIMSGISRFFSVSIAPTTFFEARHLKDLAQILRARYGAAIAAHYAAKIEPSSPESKCVEPSRERTRDVSAWLARHRAARPSARPLAAVAPAPAPSSTPAVSSAQGLAEPVAIIGMEGMFPKSPDLDAFEAHLAAGRDCIEEIPADRWDWRAVDGDPRRGPFSDVKYGGFVPGHDLFDAAFFNISPKEAELMDPQHRLFIECVWKLIEGAGHAPASLAGRKVSLFLGINLQDYADLANRAGAHDPGQLTGLGHIFCANRLSFLLDINGPSQVIDTACSSSLVALHRAVQSIRHEGCEMAIAGGANLMLTPTQHILFARVGMLARDGRCKTFSRAANGYARAEGVGALLLKRLDLAERDGDRILGVIRGSAENHGGAASSLTAPNPRAQARLIAEAHKQAGIDPRTISYMECHGTGTTLGDPVEIEGLKAAFAEMRGEHGLEEPAAPYCGLGSVKSNIGHTETAAGIAGVIKVLLGLRAGKLWQSLHCEEPNPLIDLRGSPFYLLDAPRDWARPVVDGHVVPRRAGVSSFGAGGANAHVVIEEYRDVASTKRDDGRAHLIPLSARNDAALREAAARLAAHLVSETSAAQSLADIAHTLQSGRDAMRVRLASVVHDKDELCARLEAFAEGKAEGVLTGTVERKARGTSYPGDANDLASLAAHWVAGGAVDWARLHQGRRPARVALPTYPFQRRRFWLPETATQNPAKAAVTPVEDALALEEISPRRFHVRLHPDAFFLRDHVVHGAPTLPGVLYLELMRRAILASGLDGTPGHVVWLRPLIVTAPIEIEIAVLSESEPQPRVEIFRVDADGTRQPHAQARVVSRDAEAASPRVSIEALEATHRLRHAAADIYAVFDSMGIAYGPAHRAVTSLARGVDANGRTQVFGRLHLPAGTSQDGFVLHPSLMDGAFQCALGMALNEAGTSTEGAALPFALDRVEIFGPCVHEMAVHIRTSGKGEQTSRVRTLDLDLMDMDGMVRVRMQGFATRKLAKPVQEQTKRSADQAFLFAPHWRPITTGAAANPAQFTRRYVLLCDRSEAFGQQLAGGRPNWSCRVSQSEASATGCGFSEHATALLALVQEAARASGPALLQVVIPRGANRLAGLAGLLRTAQQEVPRLSCQLLALGPDLEASVLVQRLEAYAQRPDLDCIREEGGTALAAGWRELEASQADHQVPWRDGAVYLITGGSGGLGQLFAREIASRAADVTIILASRNPLKAQLSADNNNGARLEHVALDVANALAVSDAIAGIRERHGRLDGVLHAAGLLDDGAITGKTPESLAAVLAPKVTGVCNLDRAVGNEPLDLFLLFGSISGALGNPGQADYAAANAFLDAFAAERETRRRAGLCQGRTLSVDWPLWRDGGMRMSPEAERLMTRTTGFTMLESAAAFEALYRVFGTDEPQVLVIAGDQLRIEARLLKDTETAPAPPAATPVAEREIDHAEFERKILAALSEMVSSQLKVSVDDLTSYAELSEYGFDSISFTQFANALNDRFSLSLTPTVFFEHPTLGELAAHFAREHTTAFCSVLGVLPRVTKVEVPEVSAPPVAAAARAIPTLQAPVPVPTGRFPIAIIGTSGAFPDAPDPAALWQNLLKGHDAIRDAPSDRWDRAPRGEVAARGGFIAGIGEFDAAFFGLSAPEARIIDPQQRLLLTHTWRLLEDAGYAPRRLWGADVGVFVGIADTGYGRLVGQAGGPMEGYAMTGLAPSVGPNRVSFHFNFTGPSVAVETACSSALVAIHRAAEAIHSGDCTAAIAGGVNLLLSPETFEGFTSAGMLARDGRSKTFSADADGYGRGEGIGLVLLKRLDEAERDGDRILAVIRGSAENHGGRANSLTAPNPKAQAALLVRAYERAGFDSRTVSYIETHGTGTPLGDPIEVEALGAAFATLSADAQERFGPVPEMACGIGSVKSNIGHLELAAGAAGLIKVLLQMRHGTIAPSLHCQTLNPYLKLEGSPFHVVRETEPWVRPRDAGGRELPRRAGVSAFGFGGSNAHVVLEEYITSDAPAPAHQPSGLVAIILSARSEEQLVESARQLHGALAGRGDADLTSIAFTLQTCREAMEYRLAFPAASINDVRARLAAFVAGEADGQVLTGRVKTNREMMALLDSDTEVRHALSGLGGRGRHDILMALWLRGFPFDWRTLYGTHAPPRAELPGYPFARTVHWVRPAHEGANDARAPREVMASAPTDASARPSPSKVAMEASKGGDAGKDAVHRALDRLTAIAARLLETETSALDPDTELGEFGFDSITMTSFATRVNDELGLSLTPADFFEFATLSRLARHVAGSITSLDALEVHSEASAVPVLVASAAKSEHAPDEDPIAIVGMSCTFPGAPDADTFWSNLITGKSAIREIPPDRWDWRAVHGDPKLESNKTNIHFGGFIDGVFEFDPLFFGISPREAMLMDPQQRLMMTHAWKALEDAGHAPRSLAGRPVGLFVGTSSSGYGDLLGDDPGAEGYAATGSVPSVGPNRISYFLDWHGPSEPVETACSSALVAMHRAVQAMRAGDCDIALAGGVNTIITPEAHINFAKAGMLSLDGACKTFSTAANGYVRGEGVGMLVLKRLSQAEHDGDTIYAVVRGSAINHGGRANSFTAPNTSAQADVITRAYAQAGIDPATVGYIEAHGTGTALGDPVEINALKSAFSALPSTAAAEGVQSPGCGLGSAKTNIGHLELAAGVAGVIKVLLQLRHRTLAPSLNSEPPNPYIDLAGSPFFIVREAQPWRPVRDANGHELPRRAGVSSFGFGGVNAHVVIEEYTDRRVAAPTPTSVVVPLSARDDAGLAEQVRRLLDHINGPENIALADLAFTLQAGRTPQKHRVAFVVGSVDELKADLARFLARDRESGWLGIAGPGAVPAVTETTPEAIAAHWVQGGEADWKRLDPAPRRRLHLPTYPFAREEYRAARMPHSTAFAATEASPRDRTALSLDPEAFYLRDHRIAGAPILPGAMTLELARAASGRPAPLSVNQIVWLKPVSAAGGVARVVFEGETFRLVTGNAAAEVLHVQGRVGGMPDPATAIDLDAIRARCPQSLSPAWLYDTFAALGMEYGPAFRSVTQLSCGRDEVLARLTLPPAARSAIREFTLHPSMIDGALQACLALYGEANDGGTAVPFALERVDIFASTTPDMWAHIRARPAADSVRKIDIDIADAAGKVVVRIMGFSVRILPGKSSPRATIEATRAAGARYLTALVAAETGVPVAQIELGASLDAYGIDSVMIVRLTDELEKVFGSLPTTLFFEHRTLDSVLTYFLERHGERLAAVTGEASAAARPLVVAHREPEARREVDTHSPIAIVGLAGRYPGARDLATFWDNLAAGRDCITEVPLNRWDHTRVSGLERASSAKWGGFVDGVAEFDPLFFNISPREAPYMDPQERLFLQCAYEAIEDAGYTRTSLAEGDVGVFVGVMWEEYQLYGAERTARGDPLALSSSPASIANRVSSVCDFHGPSMAVDSMCSSSLSAIHLACESLALGTCTAAIAGGVNLSLHPNKFLALTQGRFLSSSGRCESFGSGGDGYVPGEGVGAVVLKRLDRAVADGDHIYGVIRGSALNHGGKTNGYTVPNPQAQTAVIRRALEKASVEPRQISYVEAHGTGTKLGDPIEITALSNAYRAETPETGFCAIGSVKSNIGHCESAAGVAGLTKVLLQMKHRRLAPSLHSSVLNPGIDFAASPFIVQRHLGEWQRPLVDEEEMPRIAGLSSFGAGGSNAHIIIEEYDAPSEATTHAGPFVFPFSARDEAALDRVLRRFLTALETMSEADLAAAAHVLQLGREAFEVRAAVVADDLAKLRDRLQASVNGDAQHVHRGVRRAGEGEVPPRVLDARDLETIARAWTRGAHVDWQRLWPGAPPRRISLPTYPFAREIYWVPGLEIGGTSSPPPSAAPTVVPERRREDQPLHCATTAPLPRNSVAIRAPQAPGAVAGQAGETLRAVTAYLATEIAAVLNVPADKLEPNETFDRYGLDSISALDIIDTLEAKLGEIPKTLLFEYPTVARLAGSLMETHAPALRDLLHEPDGESAPGGNIEPAHSAPVAESSPAAPSESDIAIIAVAGRYPGADTPEELWQALREGRDLITEVPPSRWDIDAVFAAGKGLPGKTYCRWGGFLSNVDAFDAAFFGISPREAARMDPQERLFLETAWHVLERGGYPRRRLQQNYGAKVGVFVGAMSQQYRALEAENPGDRPLLTLTSHASLANRVSYYFDLQGPSVAVDSMCSSGLEAVHLACQALRRRECRLAIAGAVNLTIHPDKYIGLSEAGLIGSHRGSRAFAGGDGYLPAEGVGAVLLKPLADALADRDVILGVIKSTAVNHSGRSAGYGVPSAEAQCQLIENNFREAGIDPRTVGYVEAAATGAALGDAIEVRAMTRAFRSFTADTGFCAVGSVKASMGHAEAASGLAQLTKCLFQLQYRTLAPRVSLAGTDPDLEFEGTPFVLQKELAPWQRVAPEQPLRASISSFGAGGTNVHLILEEAPPAIARVVASEPAGPWRFLFSAQGEEQLASLMVDMKRYVATELDISLPRLSWTLRTCRERLACTAEIVAADRQELLRKLTAWPDGADEGGTVGRDLSADSETGPPLILPDYPFARTRHWIAVTGNVSSPKDPRPGRAERNGQRSARRLILELLAQETGLQVHVIPPTASFRDLGAASIFALRLIRAVADELNVEITNRDLEVHETVDALTALIEQRRDGARPATPDAPTPDVDGDLSEGQLGLWVLQKLYPDMSTYNVPLAFRVACPDTKALQRACTLVLERFPILARRIVEDAGTPRAAADASAIAFADILMPDQSEEAAFLKERIARPFDLSAAPPIRFELIRRRAHSENAIVLIVAHHIAIDGLSATILARAFWETYECLSEGRALPSSSSPADFQEFAAFERAHLASAKGKHQLTYWKERLAGDVPVLDLPADRAADPGRPINAASLERRLPPDLMSAVHAAAKRLRVNRPAFFLGVMNILLHRYTAANDILVGMPVMGRPARRFEESVGCFANMMVMRTAVSPNVSAAELIAAVQARLTEGLDNAGVPYAALVRELGRSPLDGPLYQVSFAYQNFFDSLPLDGGVEHIASIRQQGGDMFGIELFEDGDSLRIVANYDAARFEAARIERMVDHFITLAAAIAAAPDTPVSALDMLTGEERERILGPWATGGALPEIAGTIPEWIIAEAHRRPEEIALVVGTQRMTYRELIDHALRLAGHLEARGVKPSDRVAVLLERGAPAIVAMLGVLCAAAVYVPLDAGQPDARLAATLADAGVRAIIVDEANERRLSQISVLIPVKVQLDHERDALRKREPCVPRPIDRANAAYIIYTSGSTGRPKGVVVSHAAIADHCRVMIDHFALGEDDRVLQFSSLAVDPSLEQILPALICGASLVMREDEIWTPAQLSEVFEREAVTVADLPPAYLAEVLAAWEKSGRVPKRTPRLLICGGEALTTETVRLWREGPLAQSRLNNAYGPTEATITALTHELTPADVDATPIGRPLRGTSVYVLDSNGQPVPEGVPGELYIGGSRLALGYLGNEDMTRERFVPNPFGRGRLYRTGDRVAFIPGTEGRLAFLGRVDAQVKIRGFRVELGEVEAALAACAAGQAAVMLRDGALIAFIAADEAKFDAEAIASAMAERLPGYMCPASYIRLDALPLTPAGKVDRTLLKSLAPEPHRAPDGQDAPLDADERKMIDIWREVFGESEKDLPLGRHSDFFALGGHSLLAVRLLSAIERAYGESLGMADLIAAPTIADQVQRVSGRATPKSSSALVELRRGAGAPLFLIHPVGGGVSCYLALARKLDVGRPIYGVEAPESSGNENREMLDLPLRAAACLEALREVQPEGPYRLGGWSLGGILAYEMARQLLEAGEQVAQLILIDSYAPALLAELGGSGGESGPDILTVFARDLISTVGTEPLRRDDGRDARSIEDLFRVPELAARLAGVDQERLRSRFAVFRTNMLMVEAYRPDPCSVAAKIYVAAHGHPDRTRGWSGLTIGGLSIEDLPGDHYTLLAEPAVERLAASLAAEIPSSTA